MPCTGYPGNELVAFGVELGGEPGRRLEVVERLFEQAGFQQYVLEAAYAVAQNPQLGEKLCLIGGQNFEFLGTQVWLIRFFCCSDWHGLITV